MRLRTLAVLFVTGLVVVSVGVAGRNGIWRTHLNGSAEVPIRDTRGQGQAIFKLSKDGTSIDYKLIASNIENVFMAHIHTAAPGVNGPIVVWLYPSTTPGVTAPVGGGRTDGVLAEGTFGAGALTGPLTGQPLSALLDLLNGGLAYVNVHTDDGVAPPNTGPGDFPGGEIRGDVG
jgi:CHRD domain